MASTVQPPEDLFRIVVSRYSPDVPANKKALSVLVSDHGVHIFPLAAAYILANPNAIAVEPLLQIMMADGVLERAVLDPAISSLREATTISARAQRLQESFILHLIGEFSRRDAEAPDHQGALRRLLDLLSSLPPHPGALPVLLRLLRRPDEKIRSKVALLVKRARMPVSALQDFSQDPDPRVRANAVEGLWGLQDSKSMEVFRKAASDTHPRVMANALIGLYLGGAPEAVDQIEQMATFTEPTYQASAAWAMGRTGDPVFTECLTALARSNDPSVKRCAMQGLVAIRTKKWTNGVSAA
jgi:HEAT repeat protein